jgi:hypothetical protein
MSTANTLQKGQGFFIPFQGVPEKEKVPVKL